MVKKICIADGIEADSLIGKTVWFEAKRLVKRTGYRPSRLGGHKRYYDVVPGTVVNATATHVGVEAAGGVYNRSMDDVILESDLNNWMWNNPTKIVLQRGVQ